MKYAWVLCARCKRKVERLNAAERANRARSSLGRRRLPIDPRVLAAVRRGELTLASAAAALGVSKVTLTRRLKEASQRARE